MSHITHHTLRLLLLLCILVALAACGKKGPVRPKLLPLPAKPQGFAIEQRGLGLLLSWEIPQQNQDGTLLTDLAAFTVERLRYEPGTDCIDCLQNFELVARIDLDYLEEARRIGERIVWRDAEPQPPGGYVYRVTPITERGRAGAQARAQRPMLPLLPPPKGLSASAHDRMVRLEWEPAAAAAETVKAAEEVLAAEAQADDRVETDGSDDQNDLGSIGGLETIGETGGDFGRVGGAADATGTVQAGGEDAATGKEEKAGGTVRGWNVYRWRPGEEPPLAPLNSQPLREPAFENFGLENGQTYLFGVTSVLVVKGTRAESTMVGPVEATPQSGR